MSLSYVDSLAIGALCPVVLDSVGAAAIAISAEFEGNVALNASLSVTPPTLAITLTTLAEFTAQIEAAAALGLPSISFTASMAGALVAQWELAFTVLLELEALLSVTASFFAYTYAGTGNLFGASVTTELATKWPDGTPTAGNVDAFIFGLADNVNVSPPDIATTQFAKYLNGLAFGVPGLSYQGKKNIATLSPVVGLSVDEGDGAIQGQLDAALSIQASANITPPTFDATLSAIANFRASLLANVELALPNVSFALAATANVIADLSAKFSAIIQLGISLARADAKAFVYRYSGPANAMGAALTAALSTFWGDGFTPSTGQCNAVVLGATDSASAAALGAFFGGA